MKTLIITASLLFSNFGFASAITSTEDATYSEFNLTDTEWNEESNRYYIEECESSAYSFIECFEAMIEKGVCIGFGLPSPSEIAECVCAFYPEKYNCSF